MVKTILGMLAGAGLLIAAGVAPSGTNDVTLELDPSSGCSSYWRSEDLQGCSNCSFEARFARARADDKWESVFTFSAKSADDTHSWTLQFSAADDNRTIFRPRMLIRNVLDVQFAEPKAQQNIGDMAEYLFTWSEGRFVITMNKKEIYSAALDFEVKKFEISCATAGMRVEHLRFK